MERLLQALVCKAALSYTEIVDSFSRTNAPRYTDHLKVEKDGRHKNFVMECGVNPRFTASVIVQDRKK